MKKTLFNQACDITWYGIEFQRDFRDDDFDGSYLDGVIEATGFITSCFLVQYCGVDSIGGDEVCSALGLYDFPTKKKITKRMKRLFRELGLDLEKTLV